MVLFPFVEQTLRRLATLINVNSIVLRVIYVNHVELADVFNLFVGHNKFHELVRDQAVERLSPSTRKLPELTILCILNANQIMVNCFSTIIIGLSDIWRDTGKD